MYILLIPVLCILASLKVIIQNRSAKKHGSAVESIFFNCVMFTAASIFFAPNLFTDAIHPSTLIAGGLMGIFSVGFQCFYMQAMASGSMALTVIVNNFSMLIPTAVSVILFDEPFGLFNLIGAALALVSLMLNTARRNEGYDKSEAWHSWLLFVALTFLCNGLISVTQKLYTNLCDSFNAPQFVAIAYIIAAILSWSILAISKKERRIRDIADKDMLLGGCASGSILGIFQGLNTVAAALIDGGILYPVYNCGVSVLLVTVGMLLFGERLDRRRTAGVVVGVISIVLLCL